MGPKFPIFVNLNIHLSPLFHFDLRLVHCCSLLEMKSERSQIELTGLGLARAYRYGLHHVSSQFPIQKDTREIAGRRVPVLLDQSCPDCSLVSITYTTCS